MAMRRRKTSPMIIKPEDDGLIRPCGWDQRIVYTPEELHAHCAAEMAPYDAGHRVKHFRDQATGRIFTVHEHWSQDPAYTWAKRKRRFVR